MINRAVSLRVLSLVVIILSPFLIQQVPQDIPRASYVRLNPRWEYAGTVSDSTIPKLAAAVVWPSTEKERGRLLAIDSAGVIVEFDHVDDAWTQVRRFSSGVRVSTAIAGMPRHDRQWRIYLGSPDGQVTEISKTSMGWTSTPAIRLDDGIVRLYASSPGIQGVSQMFAVDAGGHVTNFWIGMNQDWVTRPVPDIGGGATHLTVDPTPTGLNIVTAGKKGDLYKFAQDTMGYWSGNIWTSMPAGVLDMAASADPTMKDVAVYYSGVDGVFRYLFHNHKTDDVARVAVAAGVRNLIGKYEELRYNEFFGLSGNEFCQFEFSPSLGGWDRIPLKTISGGIVSVDLRAARQGLRSQFYVASADGRIHQFTRLPDLPPDDLGKP